MILYNSSRKKFLKKNYQDSITNPHLNVVGATSKCHNRLKQLFSWLKKIRQKS